ncbi:hypothetical protein LOZ66_006406 [Ophidiomyces ophidiicola]|nr:hypothetical protein LOZ66_006406 [Ophidiomyces ophidiicola]
MATKLAVMNLGVPNQTLYCSNLPDKLKKPDLRLSLYTLFSTYGTVLDVVAMKNGKMRGQAHVVFRDLQASTQAMRGLQGFDFFGKEMKIVYAKGSSDVIAKLRGTYAPSTVTELPGISTDFQRTVFNAPPSTALAAEPRRPSVLNQQVPHGVKRLREDESDGEALMEEDESDVPMEASSDED